MRRPAPAPRPARETSATTANLLLCDVLSSAARHVQAGRFRWPVVEAFGNRYALSGALTQGWLYALPFTNDLPRLYVGDGRVWAVKLDAQGFVSPTREDLGDVFETVRFVTREGDRR